MNTTSQRKAEVGISEDWELQVRAYFDMMSPEEKADMIARIRRLIGEWEEESGLLMLYNLIAPATVHRYAGLMPSKGECRPEHPTGRQRKRWRLFVFSAMEAAMEQTQVKDRWLQVRVSEQEDQELERLAARVGKGKSALVRGWLADAIAASATTIDGRERIREQAIK